MATMGILCVTVCVVLVLSASVPPAVQAESSLDIIRKEDSEEGLRNGENLSLTI